MRLVIQRVSHASVAVEGVLTASIGPGMLILVGVEASDTEKDIEWLANKTANLRIFNDADGVMNLNIQQVGGDVIAVSQFTLMASYRKGNRPSWLKAAPGAISEPLYDAFCRRLEQLLGKPVGRGVFGADMKVDLLNDGPVTICMDSKNPE